MLKKERQMKKLADSNIKICSNCKTWETAIESPFYLNSM